MEASSAVSQRFFWQQWAGVGKDFGRAVSQDGQERTMSPATQVGGSHAMERKCCVRDLV